MYAPAERKKMLLDMKTDLMERFESVKADLEAVERLIAAQDEIEPDAPTATVEDIKRACIEILSRHVEPIHRNTLLEEIGEMGIQVGGKVPINNLGSILSRFSTDFKSHGQGMWSLTRKPPHPIFEKPEQNDDPLSNIMRSFGEESPP